MFKSLVSKALLDKGLSVPQFAKAVGVSPACAYAWLSDDKKEKYKPKADKLLTISKLLDIPIEKLIEV